MKTRYAAVMLAVLIGGHLAGQSAPQIKKTPVQKTSPASGRGMYLQYCATCHGKDGEGNGPAASALKQAPKDLTLLTIKNNGTFPDFRVAQVIDGSDARSPRIERHAHLGSDLSKWMVGDRAPTNSGSQT
jgi:mono/diheme cytochrome c family protein